MLDLLSQWGNQHWQSPHGPAIAGLLAFCGPATVAGFVVAVIVYAVQRMGWAGPWPKLNKKLPEVIPPLPGHLDAALSVVVPLIRLGIVTPVFSRLPSAVFRGSLGVAVLSSGRASSVFLFAPTAYGVATHEVGAKGHCRSSANTFAEPACPARRAIGFSSANPEHSEYFSSEVEWLHGQGVA